MGGRAEPVNLGNPHEMTILQFARLVKAIARSPSEITFVTPTDERTKDDPTTRQPDISIASGRLNWRPQVQLREGLTATIDYFRDIVGERGP